MQSFSLRKQAPDEKSNIYPSRQVGFRPTGITASGALSDRLHLETLPYQSTRLPSPTMTHCWANTLGAWDALRYGPLVRTMHGSLAGSVFVRLSR